MLEIRSRDRILGGSGEHQNCENERQPLRRRNGQIHLATCAIARLFAARV